MNHLAISAILLLAAFTSQAQAQSQLDIQSRMALRSVQIPQHKEALSQQGARQLKSYGTPTLPATVPTTTVALVKLNDGYTADALTLDGFEAKTLRGGFAVVTCPIADATRLAAHKSVRKCEFNRQRRFHMDKARATTGVDVIHNSGLGLPQAYTGKGVITGIVDGGFDPNHINFKDANGKTRFKYFSTVEATGVGSGVRVTTYNNPLSLSLYTTDDSQQTHGTHTLGIMAGSFMGEATVGSYSDADATVSVATMPNPFYGVAYNSTLYASSGSSYDALIAYAVDGMLEYRWENDHYTPIVINLSLGGNNGPHDGSGMLTQFLDTVAVLDNATICLSSGNEGDMPIAYHKTFTEEDNTFATFIRPYYYSDMRYGIVEFYSDSAEDFDVSIIIYNNARKKVARTFPLNNKEGQIQYICSGTDYKQDESDIIDATFAKAYNGYVGVGGMLDSESGRFYAAIDYYTVNTDENPADDKTTEAQYTLGFLVTGKNGQRVDCYCDGMYTALDSYGYDGYVDGMFNGSISDIATGRNTIAVGAYNTKENAGSIYGFPLGYDGAFKEGEVTNFTSFGTLADGRNLPHLVAPGNLIVSSLSTPYMKNAANGVTDQITSAKYTDSRRDHYFYPMMGTSMASPFVAGTVALMMEADPTLTYDKVREILVSTATMDDAVNKLPDPVQMGAGKLNAYAALKKVLGDINAINGPQANSNRVLFASTGYRTFKAYLAGAKQMDATLYTTTGTKALHTTAIGNEIDIDASQLTPGVYLFTVNGSPAQKIMVK